jgi:hypothetical protein
MRNDLVNEFIIDRDKTINRVIDYFSERHFFKLLKRFAPAAKIIFGKGLIYICEQQVKRLKKAFKKK